MGETELLLLVISAVVSGVAGLTIRRLIGIDPFKLVGQVSLMLLLILVMGFAVLFANDSDPESLAQAAQVLIESYTDELVVIIIGTVIGQPLAKEIDRFLRRL